MFHDIPWISLTRAIPTGGSRIVNRTRPCACTETQVNSRMDSFTTVLELSTASLDEGCGNACASANCILHIIFEKGNQLVGMCLEGGPESPPSYIVYGLRLVQPDKQSAEHSKRVNIESSTSNNKGCSLKLAIFTNTAASLRARPKQLLGCLNEEGLWWQPVSSTRAYIEGFHREPKEAS